MSVITISLAFLSLFVIQSSDAIFLPTKALHPANGQMPNNFIVKKSGGLTHPVCHGSAITKRCSLSSDFNACVQSSCSNCILQPRLQSAFNGYDMYCLRLTACVCSIIKDASCYAKTTAECH